MFEQSLVLPTPDSKRWTFALSLTLQVAAISLLMLIPLIYTDQLSQVMTRGTLFAPPLPPPPPPQIKAAPPQQQQIVAQARPFRPFTEFLAHFKPKPIENLPADPFVEAPIPICSNCVPGGTGPAGGVNLGIAIHEVAPPPPPPAPVRKADPVKTAGPMRIGGDVLAARMVKRVLPVYPPLARQARVSGTVRLQGIIAKDGTIQELQVLSGHPLLVKAAVEAVQQWVYRPTLLNGEPVAVIAPIDVNFTLAN